MHMVTSDPLYSCSGLSRARTAGKAVGRLKQGFCCCLVSLVWLVDQLVFEIGS
jgi:hypothetical protein